MTSDDNIRQQAQSLVSAHGEDAPIQAAMRAQTSLDQGDPDGSALWGRIGNMTNVLLSKTAHAAVVDATGRDSVEPVEPVETVESDNETLTLSDLPSPNIKRWHGHHKAIVVTAVQSGLMEMTEACLRYRISIQEFS